MKITDTHTIRESFKQAYRNLREKENRMYSDHELRWLPDISPSHPFYREWLARKQSSQRLIQYLSKKNHALKILEAGCGNGWLSYRLSQLQGAYVTGSDINDTELLQAIRVFGNNANLSFQLGDFRTGIFGKKLFDIILFAASIQYFPDLRATINQAMQLLEPGGEIHILDSHLYRTGELASAKIRTKSYYNKLELPGMSDYYFHHCWTELEAFEFNLLYKASALKNFISGNLNPFPWVCIKKEQA